MRLIMTLQLQNLVILEYTVLLITSVILFSKLGSRFVYLTYHSSTIKKRLLLLVAPNFPHQSLSAINLLMILLPTSKKNSRNFIWRTQNLVEHLRWNYFHKKAKSQIFDWVLNTPLSVECTVQWLQYKKLFLNETKTELLIFKSSTFALLIRRKNKQL